MPDLLERLKTALADRYAVESEIGRGGMATVFLAEDLKHHRQVAIKVLHPELAASVGSARFLREIELVARLTHPHILPLHDSGEADGLLFYVMPFVEGESLAERLEREKQLPLEEALRITRDVALALDYAHERGVVHRDIKPANILLSSDEVVVADFGIGKALDATDGDQLTETGLVAGTPAYMSPEQALGDRDIDGRTDTYSLACVTYEMLAGEPPFAGPTPQAVLARRAAGEVQSLVVVRDTVPAEMETVIFKALSRTPADRYATSGAFAEALARAAVMGKGSAAGRGPLRLALAATLGVVAILLSIGLLAVTRSGERGMAPIEVEDSPALPGVAVLPFEVSGAGVEHLREGMIELLFANLDGMTGIRPINPSTVLARWNESLPGDVQPDLETMLEVAASSGAQYAVRGSVVAVGPVLRLAASVYETSRTDPVGQGNESAIRDNIWGAVDLLSIAVLRAIGATGEGELARIDLRDVTTGFPDALKAFLRAQASYRRADFEGAAAEYERAIAEDSTFSLAYLGLGWSLAWDLARTGRGPEKPEHWQAAVRHAATERQDLLARASLGYEGAFMRDDMVAELREAVRAHPDDALLWHLLGEHYLHVGTATGAFDDHAQEAERAFERAVELVPDFAPYRFHLIDLAFSHADSSRAAELISGLEQVAPDAHEFRVHFRVAFHTSRDESEFEADLDTLEQLNALGRAYDELLGHPRLWPAARAVIERRRSGGLFTRDCALRQLSLSVGRLQEFLVESAAPPGESSCLYAVHMFDLPVSEQVLDSVMTARLDTVIHTGANPWAYRDYGVPVYLADRGRWADYDTVLALWRSSADSALALSKSSADSALAAAALMMERFWRYRLTMLEAYSSWKGGDPQRAAEMLEALAPEFRDHTPDVRWWLGNLYMELDRPADAARQFRTLQGVYAAPNWTLASYRLGEAYERLKEEEKAREQYAYVVDAWSDADPELQPWVERARVRMEAIPASQ